MSPGRYNQGLPQFFLFHQPSPEEGGQLSSPHRQLHLLFPPNERRSEVQPQTHLFKETSMHLKRVRQRSKLSQRPSCKHAEEALGLGGFERAWPPVGKRRTSGGCWENGSDLAKGKTSRCAASPSQS
ncbi:unnamed protein product [Pleuronectes platessa]|uniref:Uncharacterized protein n=1 Tax=Pleuronectes platessa TaxID=8262 RepID=A0A9N7ULW4_PLEPL|nr:unnamed protein product [Pleuronectes platessa]